MCFPHRVVRQFDTMISAPNELAIATPTFGKGRYLAICLDSIRAQTIEVDCCVCDGGTQFDFNDPKLSFVKRHSLLPDPGIVGCWNAAADLTESPYLAFLADDNALEPRFAEEMIGFWTRIPNAMRCFAIRR